MVFSWCLTSAASPKILHFTKMNMEMDLLTHNVDVHFQHSLSFRLGSKGESNCEHYMLSGFHSPLGLLLGLVSSFVSIFYVDLINSSILGVFSSSPVAPGHPSPSLLYSYTIQTKRLFIVFPNHKVISRCINNQMIPKTKTTQIMHRCEGYTLNYTFQEKKDLYAV